MYHRQFVETKMSYRRNWSQEILLHTPKLNCTILNKIMNFTWKLKHFITYLLHITCIYGTSMCHLQTQH